MGYGNGYCVIAGGRGGAVRGKNEDLPEDLSQGQYFRNKLETNLQYLVRKVHFSTFKQFFLGQELFSSPFSQES